MRVDYTYRIPFTEPYVRALYTATAPVHFLLLNSYYADKHKRNCKIVNALSVNSVLIEFPVTTQPNEKAAFRNKQNVLWLSISVYVLLLSGDHGSSVLKVKPVPCIATRLDFRL